MIKIAEVFGPQDKALWTLVKQCGVDYVVAGIGLQPKPDASPEDQPWSYTSLLRAKTAYNDAGFNFAVIESRPPMEKIKLGLPGRDEEIAVIKELPDQHGTVGYPGVVLPDDGTSRRGPHIQHDSLTGRCTGYRI